MKGTAGFKGLPGSTLKWFAIAVMAVDHVGASLLEVFLLNGYGNSPAAGLVSDPAFWWKVDRVLRILGRSAFPVFCFLLVEGAVHTRSMENYLKRLLWFALVSELPFDLALRNQIPWWEHQNVFFTLVIGLLVILVFQKHVGQEWKGMLALAAGTFAAELLHTDYGAAGVLVVGTMYLLRENRTLACLLSLLLLALEARLELWSVPGFLLLLLYNGKRGKQNRYFFYVFYPAHLLLFWLLGRYLLPQVL